MDRPIKILFIAANPKDTTPLRLDEEMRDIDQALRQAEFRDKFDIKQHWAVRISDLQGYLLRYKPDIIHFSGHGNTSNEIVLEDNDGHSRAVSIRALEQLFSVLKDNIRCVVLNACYSEIQARAIANHIDCVIGMSKAIGDLAAINFTCAFYQALGYGRNLKTAFDLGCLQIDLESLREQDTPRLLSPNIKPENIVFVNVPSINGETSEKVVALLHGIRTFGQWQELAKRVLEENSRTKCVIIRYGYFDLFRFVIPFNWFRRRAVVKVKREFNTIRLHYPKAQLFVIAHSFGAYIISRILLTSPGLKLHRLIMCGGVVQDDYPWWLVANLISGGIRNDCSRKDPWPALAKAFTIGYGAIGTYGANTAVIEDRFHDFKHSGYFSEFHIRERWKKFIEEGIIEEASVPKSNGVTSWWIRPFFEIIALVKWLLPVIILSLLVLFLLPSQQDRVNEAKWFPPQQVLDNIAHDIENDDIAVFARGYSLAGSPNKPTLLPEIHIFYDTEKFALEKQNTLFFYKFILDSSPRKTGLGQWLTYWPDKAGTNLSSYWPRIEIKSEPDVIQFEESKDSWKTLLRFVNADEIPQASVKILKDKGLTFDQLRPTVVLGVYRRQWTFTDLERTGPRWIKLQLTKVTSSSIIQQGSKPSLPDIFVIPTANLGFNWTEVEVEEFSWDDTPDTFLSIMGIGKTDINIFDRLRDFIEIYDLNNYEEDALPKYFKALRLNREQNMKEQEKLKQLSHD